MFRVFFNNETELFETNDRAEAVKFFEMCKNDIARDYDKEKATAGKGFNRDYVMSYELDCWDDDEEYLGCIEYVDYAIADWERDNA